MALPIVMVLACVMVLAFVLECYGVSPCYGVSRVMSLFAWVTRPEHSKGAKDEVKRPEGHPARSRGPEGILVL